MVKRWDKPFLGLSIGLFVATCAVMIVQRPPAHAGAIVLRPIPGVIKPGLSPVTVDEVKATSARIRWRSTWQGKSVILFGTSPRSLPAASRTAPIFGPHTELTALEPNTRYFFQVETHTPLGVALSPVCSFVTRELIDPVRQASR
ncbi:MAG: fibronectin type III domain-containing protein [Candidatus Sericytochromatia bacterium]